MTSRRSFKMAAATWQFYFRFRFWWLRSNRKVKIYLHTKFPLRYYYFRFLETNACHVGILLSVSILIFAFITITLCISLPNCIYTGPSTAELQRHSDFQGGGQGITFLFPVSFFVTCSIRKVEIYLPTKCRWDSSIHGWNITASVFWKQTSAMLELCFQFRFTSASSSTCHSASAY